MAHFRDRRAFGSVGTRRFRGARFGDALSPRFEGLLDLYPGAAAAYSLRALTSGWLAGDVVEVRRSSDSTTDTFTASQITGGAMLDFVNHGTTDLYNSARYFNGVNTNVDTPVVIDPTVASSIEFDYIAGYTTVDGVFMSDRSTHRLVDIRYLSDRRFSVNIQSTTGYNSSTSTLAYPNTGTLTWEHDPVTKTITLSRNGDVVAVNTYTGDITESTTIRIGQDRVGALNFEGSIYNINLNNQAAYTGLGTSVTAWEDTIGSNDGTEVNGAAYTGQPYDGFVSTWYDQSGNGKDATQATTTAQPKIVDAGSLVTGGLDFDGVDDELSVGAAVISSSSLFGAVVCKHRTGSSTTIEQIWGQYEGASAGRFQITANPSSLYSFFANATDPASGLTAGAIGTAQTLLTVNLNGSNGEIWRDGATQNTDTYSGFTPYSGAFMVGKGGAGSDYFNGAITELIVYNSDQESNQPGIDAEIIANYGI